MNNALNNSSLSEIYSALAIVVFDFDGVFTDNAVYVFQDGTEAVRCSRADGIGLRALERAGILPIILSTETNPVVSVRAQKLRVRCVQGCDNKLQSLRELLDELNLTLAQTAFVGNDVNDLECMQNVALPIAVADAHPDILPYAKYVTRTRGGYGAVREVCDLIVAQRRKNDRPII